MLFQQEIRPTDELDLPTRKRPGKAKVDRAVALVEALAADFDHERLQGPLPPAGCARSSRTRRPARRSRRLPSPKAPGPPPDIMEALKASLDKVRAG